MTIKFPRNSLEPGSQPWGRFVERTLNDLNQASISSSTFQKNSARGVSASLQKLGEQIRALVETQQTLAQQQAELTQQQSALAAQQAEILNLLNSQISPGVAPTVTTSAWAIDGAYGTKASTSIPVPNGYSRALVYASGSISLVNNGTDAWGTNVFAYIDIAGGGGSEQQCWLGGTTSGRGVAVVTPMHTRTLGGLSGGSIPLQIVAGLGSTTGVATDLKRAQVGGFAIFLR